MSDDEIGRKIARAMRRLDVARANLARLKRVQRTLAALQVATLGWDRKDPGRPLSADDWERLETAIRVANEPLEGEDT